ncbi:MAG: hypothetical protein ACRCS0_05295, partial [Albidovulum sp.]
SLPGDQCFLEIITIPPESSRSQDSAPHRLRQSPFKDNATPRSMLRKSTIIWTPAFARASS